MAELLRQADSRELSEWMQMYGIWREEQLRAGLEQQAVRDNEQRVKRKRG